MNLTKQSVYQKGANSLGKPPTAEEKHYWGKLAEMGCIINNHECEGRTTIHHAGTGAGGRKNHKRVLPLCIEHHLGERGINSLTGAMSRREWEEAYGMESELLAKLETII